jgi:hypothetical protein
MAGQTRLHGTAGLAVLGAAVAVALALVPSALSGRVSGAISTTTNPSYDNGGTGSPVLCSNGPGNTTPSINCNLYTAKQFVWLSGLPAGATLADGRYFFVVVAPGGQNGGVADGSPKNLSSPYDPYTAREFSVSNGVITNLGTHVYDPVTNLLRVFPYADTPNPGGEYDLAVCRLGPKDTSATVNPSDCKHDNFNAQQQQQAGVTPELTTTILNDINGLPFEGSAAEGAVVHDVAALAPTSGGIPTGTVSFTWFASIDCTGPGTNAGSAAVDGSGSADGSVPEGPLAAGDYSFVAHFTSSSLQWTNADSTCEPLHVEGGDL